MFNVVFAFYNFFVCCNRSILQSEERELVLFCNRLLEIVWFLFGGIFASPRCLRWAAQFYCGTPCTIFIHVVIFLMPQVGIYLIPHSYVYFQDHFKKKWKEVPNLKILDQIYLPESPQCENESLHRYTKTRLDVKLNQEYCHAFHNVSTYIKL